MISQIPDSPVGEIKGAPQGASLGQSAGQGGFGDMLLSLLQNLYPMATGQEVIPGNPGMVLANGQASVEGKKTGSLNEGTSEIISEDDSGLISLVQFLQKSGLDLNQTTPEKWQSAMEYMAENPGIQKLMEGFEKQGFKIDNIPKLSPEEFKKLETILGEIKSIVTARPDKENKYVTDKKSHLLFSESKQIPGKNEVTKASEIPAPSKELKNQDPVTGDEASSKISDTPLKIGSDETLEEIEKQEPESQLGLKKTQAAGPKMNPEDFKNFVEVSLENENSEGELNLNSQDSKSKGKDVKTDMPPGNLGLASFINDSPENSATAVEESDISAVKKSSKEYIENGAANFDKPLPEEEIKRTTNLQKVEKIFQQLQQLNGKISLESSSKERQNLKSDPQSRNSKIETNISRSFLMKTDTGWELKGQREPEMGEYEEKEPLSELKDSGQIRELSTGSKGSFEFSENTSFESLRPAISNSSIPGVEQPESTHNPKHIWGQEKEIIRQISQGIISVEKDGVKEIKINLHPASLGKIKIVMEMHGDKINGKIEVENDDVRRVVEHNLHKLKESVQQHQVRLDSIEVSVDPDKSHTAARQEREGKWGQNFNQGNNRDQQKKGGFGSDSDAGHRQRDTRRRWGYNTLELVA